MQDLSDIEKTQCPELARWLRKQTKTHNIILDIGCGNKWYQSFLQYKKIASIDAWFEASPDLLLDLEKEDLPNGEKWADIILMLDFIEHLTKQRGKTILEQAKKIVKEKIILLTPLQWSENEPSRDSWYCNNPYERHQSLWSEDDFAGWKRISTHFFSEPDEYFLGIWRP